MIYIWLSRANELYLRCLSDTTASALYHEASKRDTS